MRVVHIVRQFWPAVGGLEEATRKLCRALAERHGAEVSVVTLDRRFEEPGARLPLAEVVDGLAVARVPYRGSRRYPLAPGVLRHLGGADLVHVHAIDFFFDFLALTRPLHRRPLVASTHGGFFHTTYAAGLKQAYFRTVTRASAGAYARILASSEADAALFRPIVPDRLVTVENGVDAEKLRGAASPALGRGLLAFGRLSPNKRVGTLLPLLRELRALSPDWRLVVAGREDGVSVAALRAEAEALGVEGAVSFVPAPDDAGLARLAAEASYFASPSAHEGFGLAAVEAMSAGLVPLLSPIPPFRALLDRAGLLAAGAGLLLDPEDPRGAAARGAARAPRRTGEPRRGEGPPDAGLGTLRLGSRGRRGHGPVPARPRRGSRVIGGPPPHRPVASIRRRSASGRPSSHAASSPGSGRTWPYSTMSRAGRSAR